MIDRALHVQHVSLLVPRGDCFEDPVGATSRLPAAATLVALAAGSSSALSLDLVDASSPLRRLSSSEVTWLSASGAKLLLPLLGSEHEVRGLLLLGEKRSEAPYTAEDRFLLQTVAAATVLPLERLLRARPSIPQGTGLVSSAEIERPAQQCVRCGRVFEAAATECDACALSLTPAPVPVCLAGKFRVLSRLGAGGMGVVYKGEDIELGRLVAIKTLPQLSESASRRLRREARALATVHHPNLEIIHGVEFCHGVPMLVLEYLAGGTLAARLMHGTLEIGVVVQIGTAIAEALHGLHRVGVLHRDVKPSNIGFTADGVPKLLDFGLATLAAPDSAQPAADDATTRTHPRALVISSVAVVGTPLYMSPEAISGGPPEVGYDLWALAVTIFEALAGQHPFRAQSRAESARLILTGVLPDLRDLRSDCPAALAELLSDALSLDRSRRPRSARELGNRLGLCARA